MEEKELYPLQNNVLITSKKCVVDGETHAISSMADTSCFTYSAEERRKRSIDKRRETIMYSSFGVVGTLGLFIAVPNFSTFGVFLVAVGIGYLAFRPAYLEPDQYSVKVRFPNGKKDIYKSFDKDEVEKISQVLTQAIIDC